MIFKPYTTSPLSSSQYIVCHGLKGLNVVSPFFTKLESLYANIHQRILKEEHGTSILDFPSILDLSMIEDEYHLNQYITNWNQAIWSMRADIIHLATANHQDLLRRQEEEADGQKQSTIENGRFDIDPLRAFETKESFLK